VLLLLSCPLLPAPGWLGCAPTGFFVPGLVWCLWLVGLGLLACVAVLWVSVGLDSWHKLGGLWRAIQRFGGSLALKAQGFFVGCTGMEKSKLSKPCPSCPAHVLACGVCAAHMVCGEMILEQDSLAQDATHVCGQALYVFAICVFPLGLGVILRSFFRFGRKLISLGHCSPSKTC